MPPGQCPGNTSQDAVCRVCQTLACPFGTYQKACSQYTDTACVAYTQCTVKDTTLRNRGQYNDGVCTNCTKCSAFGLNTLANCSQYQDTLCAGTPCSAGTPCLVLEDRSYYCDFGSYGTQTVNSTSPGVCGMCPEGYSSDGLFCYECPRSKTCTRFGDVWCQGEVAIGKEPGCFGQYAQPEGPCEFPADPTRIVTRSTFIRPNGTCAPYFRCAPGYFKRFYSIGAASCESCLGVVPLNFRWFSGGLSVNDPLSCLYECIGRASWPDGACLGPLTQAYVPANPAGYYDDGTGSKRCAAGYTSLAGQAISPSDCVLCPTPRNSLGDACGDWTCQVSATVILARMGDSCLNPSQCPSLVGYTQSLNLACVPTSLPWQPAGWAKAQDATGALIAMRRENVTSLLPPLAVLAIQGPGGNTTLTFYSAGYGQSGRHWVQGPGAANRTGLPGRVCSAALLAFRNRDYALLAFCNTSFLSFLDLTLKSPLPRLLIGSSTEGYQEGYRDAARFSQQLYLAVEAGSPRVYVSDQLNCAVRVVSIPEAGYPGDFLTRSHWLYGKSFGTCKTIQDSIIYPGRLFGVLSQTFFLFPASDGLYQIDSGTRRVVQAFALSQAPSWLPDLSLLVGVALGNNGTNASELRLLFANFTAVVVPSKQRCSQGYTSYLGGACDRLCPFPLNYVDPDSGACVPCFTRSCLRGEQDVPCTPSSAQACVACPPLQPLQGLYPRIYSTNGSCAEGQIVRVSYCPANYYLSSKLVGEGLRECKECPRFSATAGDGATSIDQCRCSPGSVKGPGGVCIVGQLYPLPSLSKCPFGTYPRGVFERCSSCRIDPFPDCPVGQYPVLNGSCIACTLPYNAFFTSNGKGLGSATSCGFECLPGYYLKGNTSFQTQCQPCTNYPVVGSSGAEYYALTNAQLDSPQGCTWACRPPFKIYLGQCVACELANLAHAGMFCTHPWLSVNASAGAGAVGVLDGVRYRMIRFNASGYVVFSQNATVDLLIVAGGAAGGTVPSGIVGAGGGGGAGQVIMGYNVSVQANVLYTVRVGLGGFGNYESSGDLAQSSSFKPTLLLGAYRGGTGGSPGWKGATGASGGGAGSNYIDVYPNSLTNFYGGAGKTNMAGGGGGSACIGGSALSCQAGSGGCGTVLWKNSSLTFFDPDTNLMIAGGGGGGSALQECPAGFGAAGGGAGGSGASSDGQSALPNTGSGGGGGSVNGAGALNGAKGGDGGSGLVVLRFVDESCGCY